MKRFILSLTPTFALRAYHYMRSFLAAMINGFPARRMIVVGITGTKGKTSTANFIWSVLHAGGYKVGQISTANFRIGENEEINPFHMTMPDPFIIQNKLRKMKDAGMEIVVMEMTSEGMKQFRHIGIPADIAVFTNLTPEHLPSHGGSFEKYKRAKAPLFRDALNHKPRSLRGKIVPRTIIANIDNEHADFYMQFPADRKVTFGFNQGDVHAANIVPEKNGVAFSVKGITYHISIPGAFNVYNALPAVVVGELLGESTDTIKAGLVALGTIPGRMDEIKEGQNFRVFVDYAHEPASFEALLRAGRSLAGENKVIVLTGGQGGGRDKSKRAPMGRLAAELADYAIIANEDPYRDDPMEIIRDLATSATQAGKEEGKDLFSIIDRREAIRKALSLASEHDIVLIAGKGAEQTMMVKSGSIPWNEREIVRGEVRASLT